MRLRRGCDLRVLIDNPESATGVAIVLLHGLAGSLHTWDPVVAALAPKHQTIRFDLLGHGDSAKPRSGYAMEHQAELLDRALVELEVGRALLVGHSLGGVLATALAAREPMRAAGVALVNAPAHSHTGNPSLLGRLGLISPIGQAMRALATDGLVRRGLEGVFFAPGFAVPRQSAIDYRRTTHAAYVSCYRESHAYLDRESLDRRLAALGLPLLVLFGTRDTLVAPASQRAYASVPGARIEALTGTGHSPMIERPADCARALLAFAGRLPPSEPLA